MFAMFAKLRCPVFILLLQNLSDPAHAPEGLAAAISSLAAQQASSPPTEEALAQIATEVHFKLGEFRYALSGRVLLAAGRWLHSLLSR